MNMQQKHHIHISIMFHIRAYYIYGNCVSGIDLYFIIVVMVVHSGSAWFLFFFILVRKKQAYKKLMAFSPVAIIAIADVDIAFKTTMCLNNETENSRFFYENSKVLK